LATKYFFFSSAGWIIKTCSKYKVYIRIIHKLVPGGLQNEKVFDVPFQFCEFGDGGED
jgi:hypothetical protein